MTHGIEIFNAFGEKVVDFNRCFSIQETGNSQNWAQSGFPMRNSGQPNFPITDIRGYDFVTATDRRPSNSEIAHVMKGSVRRLRRKGAGSRYFSNDWVPFPLVEPESLYFFQLGSSGLLHHSEYRFAPELDLAFNQGEDLDGAYGLMIPFNNTSLPFIRVANRFDGLTGNYGAQIRGEGNEVLFDSRTDFLSISEVLFVPRTTINNILVNNAVVDIPLRTSVPNGYFALPNHTSWRINPGGGGSARFRHVRVRQPNANTVQLRRENYGPNFSTGSFFNILNDLVIIVARNPLI